MSNSTINRLAPPQGSTLAQRYTDEKFNEIIKGNSGRVSAQDDEITIAEYHAEVSRGNGQGIKAAINQHSVSYWKYGHTVRHNCRNDLGNKHNRLTIKTITNYVAEH